MDILALSTRQNDISKHREMLVQNLGVYELRALAREIGVPSPTTKKREELINLILDKIYNKEQAPVIERTKRGRPYKKLANLDDILTEMTGGEFIDTVVPINRPIKYEDIICFAQDVPVFSNVDQEVGEFKGVMRSTANVAYFIDYESSNIVFITYEEIEHFSLKDGDFIECSARKINTKNQFMAVEIKKINFVEAKYYELEPIGSKTLFISQEKLPYGNIELFCGRRNLIEYKSNLFEDNRFLEFAQYCDKKNYVLLTLGLNTSFEDQIMFEEVKNMVNFTTSYGSGCDEGFNRVVDAISLAQRLIEAGKHCVLFIRDIVEVLRTLDSCFNDETMKSGHKEKAVIIAQRLISLGKAYKEGGCISIVMTYRDIDAEDEYLKNDVKKISNLF